MGSGLEEGGAVGSEHASVGGKFRGGGRGWGGGRRGKLTIFVESAEQAHNFDVAEHFGTVPEMAGRMFNWIMKE